MQFLILRVQDRQLHYKHWKFGLVLPNGMTFYIMALKSLMLCIVLFFAVVIHNNILGGKSKQTDEIRITEQMNVPTRFLVKNTNHDVSNFNKYVIVIPTVLRQNGDVYLRNTLDMLNKSNKEKWPTLLINGNNPPENHIFLKAWCRKNQNYKTLIPPPVPYNLIRRVINNDKRHDTESYLRWRTIETMHALFGLKEAIKLSTSYIVWLEDDINLDTNVFQLLVKKDVICLLKGKEYCRSVGYVFSRRFAMSLIENIEKYVESLPIDWIIDKTSNDQAFTKGRIGAVEHIGKKSSKVMSIFT